MSASGSLGDLDAHYPVVVVGASAAGAAAAADLVREGRRACIFERAVDAGALDPAALRHLDAAARVGAEFFTGIDVVGLERAGARWLVVFQPRGVGREKFDGPPLFALADAVVLATGPAAIQSLLRPLGIAPSGATALPPGLTITRAGAPPPPAGSDAPLSPDAPGPVGLRFTECMKGAFSTAVRDEDYARGLRLGHDEGSRFEFVLTLISDDARELLDAPDHPARMLGTVLAPALSPMPLVVARGDFNLFVETGGSRRMRYRMRMVARDGREYFMDGFKVIRDDPGFDLWSDTTTLYVTVFDGPRDTSPVLGRGMLHIHVQAFARQLTTFEVLRARHLPQRLRTQAAFLRLFLGTLFDTYAGVASYLPDVRRRGGPVRAAGAVLGYAALAALFLWPWRPSALRQEPEIAAARAETEGPAIERLRLGASWIPDNIVQTHGALAPIPLHPGGIRVLADLPLRRGFVNLAQLRDESGQVVGVGSQIETVSLDSSPLRHDIKAHTTWTVVLPARGILFLSQKEGGAQMGERQAQAKQDGQPWRGLARYNHTLGPLPDARGVVHGGAGEFARAAGWFREFNILHEVPAVGDIAGDTEIEVVLTGARSAVVSASPPPADPLADRALARPSDRTCGQSAGRPCGRSFDRSFEIDLAQDIVYRTAGARAARQGPIPADLGALSDVSLDRVEVLLARLRDERGDVVGLAAAVRIVGHGEEPAGGIDPAVPGASGPGTAGADRPGPAGLASAWTLLLPGEGTIFVAVDGAPVAAESFEHEVAGVRGDTPAGAGFLGARRGRVAGGTGLYAFATGTLDESWPGTPADGSVRLGLRITTE